VPRIHIIGRMGSLGRIGSLALVAVAACEPTPDRTTTPAPATVAPTTVAPTVRWTGSDFQATGLPAIASDGSMVVIAHIENDGGRGNPNLALLEKDRSDRVVHRLLVLHPNEADPIDRALITRRVDEATRWLRERHTSARLTPLTALDVDSSAGYASPPMARGPGVTLRWAPSPEHHVVAW
jgi:hypothetical protein